MQYKSGFLWPKARKITSIQPLRKDATLGERMRYKRKTLGWDVKEMARFLSSSPSHIYGIEVGRDNTSPKLREKIEVWLAKEEEG